MEKETPVELSHNLKLNPLYTLPQMLFGSILSPYAGIYMIARNYEELGMQDKKKRAYSIGSIICLLFAFVIVLAPAWFEKFVPDYLFVALWLLLIYLYVERTQLPIIKEHQKRDGLVRPHWKIIPVSIFSAIIFLLLFIAIQISYDLLWKYVTM